MNRRYHVIDHSGVIVFEFSSTALVVAAAFVLGALIF